LLDLPYSRGRRTAAAGSSAAAAVHLIWLKMAAASAAGTGLLI